MPKPFAKGRTKTGGRRKGTPNKGTERERRLIAEGDDKAIVDKVIEGAKLNEAEARRLYFRHLRPPAPKPLVPFALPHIDGPGGLPQAVQAAIEAASKGELALEDAERVVGLLNGLRQAYETTALAAQLNEMKEELAALVARTGR